MTKPKEKEYRNELSKMKKSELIDICVRQAEVIEKSTAKLLELLRKE